ncbi:MAG: putative sugar phosphate isomerase YwlF [Phycisphaerae bacterium]|nr:putative sugar phosphate isomerase YwlF [Phycisphaerae bacterium]
MDEGGAILRVAIGADHGGLALKQAVVDRIELLGHSVLDFGAGRLDVEDDYPDYAVRVSRAVNAGVADRGVLLCGSGVGMVLAANRIPGVRACLCHDIYSASQGVSDDGMNVLCLGGRVIGPALAAELVEVFLATRFRDEPRFTRRLDKLRALEDRPDAGA